MTVRLRFLTKPMEFHYCVPKRELLRCVWKPVAVVASLYPETEAEDIRSLSPALATYCPRCGELWAVLYHDGG